MATNPACLLGSLHGPGYSGDDAITQAHILAQGGFDLGFHVFAVEWDAESITWLVDGHVYHQRHARPICRRARAGSTTTRSSSS